MNSTNDRYTAFWSHVEFYGVESDTDYILRAKDPHHQLEEVEEVVQTETISTPSNTVATAVTAGATAVAAATAVSSSKVDTGARHDQSKRSNHNERPSPDMNRK